MRRPMKVAPRVLLTGSLLSWKRGSWQVRWADKGVTRFVEGN